MGSVGRPEHTADSEPLISDVERQEDEDTAGHPDAPIDGAPLSELEEDDSAQLPRFLEEEGKWKQWKWVPYPFRRIKTAAAKWARGPQNPRDFKIRPIFPTVQLAPLVLLDKVVPRRKHKIALVIVGYAAWILTFALVMRHGLYASEIDEWGSPGEIGCGNTYWLPGNRCGLNGNDCRPFNGSGFAFRCPANCESYQVLNPRAVGDQEIVYRPLVIGGPDGSSKAVYRGDSFICGSAIHAGVISNAKGGCGVVTLVGERQSYTSSKHHGIKSVGFDSYFPLSYTFQGGVECKAQDVRWSLLGVSLAFTILFSLLTRSPAMFFFTIFTGTFWHVGLASDPPNHHSTADLISDILGRYLPAMFCAWVMYDKMGVRRTLLGLRAQIEKTILWLGGCWVGALTNYTFDFIPIQRLTAHDLEAQPGAKAALALIIVVLSLIVLSQIWYFRQEGRLIRYGTLYLVFLGSIAVCLVLPDMNLRIHHYVLALLLLPGTSMQTRPALLYQGLLVGLFVNGIARWGFDPILQTAWALRGDAPVNSPLPALVTAPAITMGANMSTITFKWGLPPKPEYDGISVLVNDVERFRGYFGEIEYWNDEFTWSRSGDQDVPEYFRFAYMEGSRAWDYTRAGTWTRDGEWIQMKPGPSRVKSRSLDGEERAPLRGR
ncbi:LCCL domain-containing protein [Pleurostoma richardsiae]|uniref:LCCL domain-containing protein n=1 Tax=Pleurostoma richardsiae TaxID=41990 RepID=A0AA38RHE9_9PEZI|nr:LCCL domain-containing protein [Pleurostoma richardsiae]